MTAALVHVHGPQGNKALVADLEAAGITVAAVVADRAQLLTAVVRHAPDVLVVDEPRPGEALFKVAAALLETAPCAVLLFTSDSDADQMERAIASGIHGYVVNGYSGERLRALVHLAQARFRHDAAQRKALQDVTSRLEDRRLVDRAKGILMRTRQVSDDDAFQILRTVSMHTNQRMGQVSQHIIHAARSAEDVNRAGQLRMLSQRLVTLYLLRQAGLAAQDWQAPFEASVQRIAANLAHLAKNLSAATYGDLLQAVVQTWDALHTALQASAKAEDLERVDALAEQLLQGADRLTTHLESAGVAPPLRVLNMAGRQRMLSQRFAKYAVLGLLEGEGAAVRSEAGMAAARAAFEQALTTLNALPLSTPAIHRALEAAGIGWLQLLALAKDAARATGAERRERLRSLALASEYLLDVFEQLSEQYEHSMQTLAGH